MERAVTGEPDGARERGGAERVSLRQAFSYGSGSVATGIFAASPGLFLLFYMTEILGVTAFLAGFALFLPRIWDVITDPFMGSISDRTVSRMGRRRPYLLLGALTTPVCFMAIYMAPAFADPMHSFFYVTAVYALAATGFTIFAVPYIAMPAEMTSNIDERTRILAFRMAALVIGLLVAGAAGPEIIKAMGGGREGYRAMGLVLAAVMLVTMTSCFLGTAGTRHIERAESGTSYASRFAAVFRDPEYRLLIGAYALQTLGIGGMLATLPFFGKYILLGDETTITILFLCLVLPSFLTMPVWVWLSLRLGKTGGYMLSIGIFGLAALVLYPVQSDQAALAYVAAALMGLGYAGTQLFPFSILPDVIARDRVRSGETREGVFTGLWTAGEKTSMAAGGFLAATILDLAGFVESRGGIDTVQGETALFGIRIAFILVPACLLLISLPVLVRLAKRIRRPTG